MTIEIRNIIGSVNAISQSDGNALFKVLEKEKPQNIVIDFKNIQFLSTAFLNASIGRLAQMHPPQEMQSLSILYPEGREVFKSKIDKVIENAALGDFYDKLVDGATS